MVSAGDFRKGVTIEIDGQVWVIVDFQHVKPGKGAAFVRTKIKNVVTGNVLERTFNPTEKFPKAMVERKEMQYLYSDGDLYYFMDLETYDQLPLGHALVEDAMQYVKENSNVTVKFCPPNDRLNFPLRLPSRRSSVHEGTGLCSFCYGKDSFGRSLAVSRIHSGQKKEADL